MPWSKALTLDLQVSAGFILAPPLWFGSGTPRNQVHAGLWLAVQAADKSKAAHEHSTQANNKSQQQK
jgi:hypothetical protein